jgi:hypothetical protein
VLMPVPPCEETPEAFAQAKTKPTATQTTPSMNTGARIQRAS